MVQKPLDILKKGLDKLSKKNKKRKDELSQKLSCNEAISQADEEWLDNEGNMADEQCVLDMLEGASDYEQGVACLDNHGKEIVKKLQKWAGNLPAGKKRKRNVSVPHSQSIEADLNVTG